MVQQYIIGAKSGSEMMLAGWTPEPTISGIGCIEA